MDCETSVPLIYDAYLKPETVEMFAEAGVLTEKELHARNEVKWEMYTKKIQIEARVLGDLSMNHIIPVATRYQSLLLVNVYKIQQVYPEAKAKELSAMDSAIIEDIAKHICTIKTNVDAMVEARNVANRIEDERTKAMAYHDTAYPYFDKIRHAVDELELTVDNEMWTLPKYRELLFTR